MVLLDQPPVTPIHEPLRSSLNATMLKRLSTPLQAVVVACALAVGLCLIITACAEQRVTAVPALEGDRAPAPGETRMVLLRPVMRDGRTAYTTRVVFLRPVPATEPWPAELEHQP
jgi:hypothetical protein